MDEYSNVKLSDTHFLYRAADCTRNVSRNGRAPHQTIFSHSAQKVAGEWLFRKSYRESRAIDDDAGHLGVCPTSCRKQDSSAND
ncbi:hypothetical protein NPIL_214141 [Nephila pilipes]|uniref:Uncharacterized protein n=1 Tax=Nephila pilipes TaxID=299642 RepID=A0A8X6P6S3_NEPPI|nr:hypothetical protein NPIL_214141 [Nephila pilipes]